jgi:hypothetical protein
MLMAPPLPVVAELDPMDTDPVLPELEVPELNTSTPLTPLSPEFAVRTVIVPVVLAIPCPVVIEMAPPV